MSSTLIWVLVAAVVVLVLLALVALYLRRRKIVYRDRAEELRRHALFQSEDIPAKEADARGARSAADEARLRAEEMEAEARQKEAALERARSRVEDTVREADRIDPEVKHKSGAYVPSLALDEDDTAADGSAPSDESRTGPSQGVADEAEPAPDAGPVTFGTSPVDATADDAHQPDSSDFPDATDVADRGTTAPDGPYEQPAPPSGPKHAAD